MASTRQPASRRASVSRPSPNPISIACPGATPAASTAAMPFANRGRGSRPIVDW